MQLHYEMENDINIVQPVQLTLRKAPFNGKNADFI